MDRLIQGRLLLVGGGAMGEAILAGILSSGRIAPDQIIVVEPSDERRLFLGEHYACEVIPHVAEQSFGPEDVCLLAVKPQVAFEVLANLKPHLDCTLLISIAVGITIADYYKVLDSSIPVVRVMPNMPISIGQGVSLVSSADNVMDAHKEIVTELFESAGVVEHIPEEWQTAGATISGSGPAYFSYMIDALMASGTRAGMPRDLSLRLAAHTAIGASNILLQSNLSPQQLMDATASPGGTTEVALKMMDERGVNTDLVDAFSAAEARATELESRFENDLKND